MDTTTQNVPLEIKKEKKSDFWLELGKLAVIAIVVVVPFRLFIAQPFIVDGASMDPTFATGQYLVVDEVTYHFHTPARGSVLIFKYPNDTSKYFIKRVIGLPGETVKINNGIVTIINAAHPEGITLDEPYIVYKKADSSTLTLSNDEYFVMGDNRLGSADSRLWGPVPTKDIVGRPIVRFWPLALWPGDKTQSLNVQTN
ncbi:MAG: signal peptidase signal peptidase [Parcubacteria group bacterium]|nr:signal peptidase signal peptidase [Parcubacteria group bacterium]